MPRSNDEWLAAMRRGDSDAAADLHVYLRKTLARGFGRQLADAELDDMAQATVVRVLERLDSFRGDSAFPTWVASVGVNLALGQLRKRRFAAVNFEEAIQAGRVSLGHDPEAVGRMQRSDASQVLHDAIESSLSEAQREALLAELGGLPLMEIARRTGRNRGALYKMLHDARKKLRAALEAQGLSAQDLLEHAKGEAI